MLRYLFAFLLLATPLYGASNEALMTGTQAQTVQGTKRFTGQLETTGTLRLLQTGTTDVTGSNGTVLVNGNPIGGTTYTGTSGALVTGSTIKVQGALTSGTLTTSGSAAIVASAGGKILMVDPVLGNNATATRGGASYATYAAALSQSQRGDTLWLLPGKYLHSGTTSMLKSFSASITGATRVLVDEDVYVYWRQTYTTSGAHGFAVNDRVKIKGTAAAGLGQGSFTDSFDGEYQIAEVPSSTSFVVFGYIYPYAGELLEETIGAGGVAMGLCCIHADPGAIIYTDPKDQAMTGVPKMLTDVGLSGPVWAEITGYGDWIINDNGYFSGGGYASTLYPVTDYTTIRMSAGSIRAASGSAIQPHGAKVSIVVDAQEIESTGYDAVWINECQSADIFANRICGGTMRGSGDGVSFDHSGKARITANFISGRGGGNGINDEGIKAGGEIIFNVNEVTADTGGAVAVHLGAVGTGVSYSATQIVNARLITGDVQCEEKGEINGARIVGTVNVTGTGLAIRNSQIVTTGTASFVSIGGATVLLANSIFNQPVGAGVTLISGTQYNSNFAGATRLTGTTTVPAGSKIVVTGTIDASSAQAVTGFVASGTGTIVQSGTVNLAAVTGSGASVLATGGTTVGMTGSNTILTGTANYFGQPLYIFTQPSGEVSIGANSYGVNGSSIAIGGNSTASANSVAVGVGAYAIGANQVAIGEAAIIPGNWGAASVFLGTGTANLLGGLSFGGQFGTQSVMDGSGNLYLGNALLSTATATWYSKTLFGGTITRGTFTGGVSTSGTFNAPEINGGTIATGTMTTPEINGGTITTGTLNNSVINGGLVTNGTAVRLTSSNGILTGTATAPNAYAINNAGSYSITSSNAISITSGTGGGVTITSGSGQSVTVTTGSNGTFTISATGTNAAIQLAIGGTNYWKIDKTGNLLCNTDNVANIGASGDNRPANVYARAISIAGSLVATQDVTARDIYAGQSNSYSFTNNFQLRSPSNGVITLYNWANTGFTRLQFGGTSASFVGLSTTNNQITFGNADGSSGGGVFLSGTLTMTGTAQRGSGTLVSGSARITTPGLSATTAIIVVVDTGASFGALAVPQSSKTSGTAGGFSVVSALGITDTSTFDWVIVSGS